MSLNEEAVTPVYLRSADSTWVPALQLKSHDGKATVTVPKFKDEQAMLQCGKKSRNYKYHNNQVVDLEDYTNNVLPMQNVDANGNLEDYMELKDLPFMHEAAILYNLKLRHIREKPYTRAGDIVMAVNPYQWLNELYTEEKRSYYSNRLVWERSDEDPRDIMQPHVYEVSALAYKNLAFAGDDDCADQSILVSGESGAGKTETVKICLNHIASIQRGQAPPGYFADAEHDPVVKRVVESNPLLEAFGNAKTRRNDNSSRFGKYLQLQFQKNMAPSEQLVLQSARCGLVGSKCDVYLLEKNRVIGHDAEERNFHIFYQLLAAPDEQKAQFWEGLRGTSNKSFKYVGATKTDTIEGVHDADRFQETLQALELVGVQGERLHTLMQALCIVLQLGNMGFRALCADQSAVATTAELEALADLMGVSRQQLALAFTERTFVTDKETHKVPLNAEAAKEACDALAKEAYLKTFLWLVNSINQATCAKDNDGATTYNTIGLLDIFGFEVFPQNRFEQLCINYANEKLQQKFNEDIFKNVQAEYRAEGIPLDDVKYDDNTDVLDLIEGRTGLLNLLNEECIRPKGNDLDFVHKALRINSSSPTLIVHKQDRLSFAIQHYAGVVMYDAEFFVSKNLDTLPTDLQECAKKCSNSIISTPRSEPEVAVSKNRFARRQSNITAPTVWTKYKSQLSTLMENLRKTQSRYIRCIKPNTKKQPLLMEHQGTVEQLRCAGVVAGITIARSSYPNRLPNSVVLARYSNLWDTSLYLSEKREDMSGTEKRHWDCKALLEGALKSKEVVNADGKVVKAFAVGKTKTFFRAGALEFLESGRMGGLDRQATIIQRAMRGWISRNGGRHERQKREMEKAMREAALRAEAERRAKMERERAEQRAARQSKIKLMADRVKALEKSYQAFNDEQDRKVADMQARNRAGRRELEAMKLKFSAEEEHDLKRRLIEKARQEKKLEQNMKLMVYVKKENKLARKERSKVQAKYDVLVANNKKIKESNEALIESLKYETELVDRLKNCRGVAKGGIAQSKVENSEFGTLVSKEQATYMETAQQRLKLQKNLAKILTLVQNKVKDRNIVEEAVVAALRAESNYKSIMTALDVATGPDLTCSDVSECGSDFSDYFS